MRLFKKSRVYLDNTATTQTRPEVARDINQYFSKVYGNPSSIHRSGLIARGSIEMARERIARVLNCHSDEIIFTASGSEANNLALQGTAQALGRKGRHIITSQIEHSSIINTCRELETQGWEVTYLSVNNQGRINLEELSQVMQDNTVLVSLGYANNEIGTIQDINKIADLVKNRGILLHSDAVQALPYMKIDLAALNVDLVSFSGHKLYAPKGVGALFVRRGTPLHPVIFGGQQEFGLRSGTENVAYIVGFSRAVNLNDKEKNTYTAKLTLLRDRLIKGVLDGVPDVILTGDRDYRLANNASFCLRNINGKMLVKELSALGIEVSSGAACSSPRNESSHVISACGIPADYEYGSLRVTLGRYNSARDVKYFLQVLPQVVKRMRENKQPYHNENIFISQEAFRKLLDDRRPIQILDVRQVKHPAKMIPGSIFIPVWRLKHAVKKLDPNAETIVVCYQGDILSPDVQQILVRKGFSNVKVLQGGIFSYVGYTR